MSENGGSWPPGWRPPQDPRFAPDPRRAPLPPGYEPVHHEPRYDDPRPPARPDSPWRRTQRLSRPEATGWHPGQPVHARYDEDPARPGGEDPYLPAQDDDGYEVGSTFVPGFGDYDDADDGESRQAVPPGRERGPSGPGQPSGGRSHSRSRSRSHSRGRGGSSPPEAPPSRPAARRRRFRWIAPWAAAAIILIPLVAAGIYGFSFYMSKYHPADYSGDGTGHVVVQVTSGDTPTSLGPKLVKAGVVASSRAFVLAAEHSSNPSGLLPGFYGLHKQMKATLAYAALLNPADLVQIKVTIPEGWRLTQIVARLGAKSGISASAYEKVLKNPASLGLPSYAGGKPEGYLFPATYEVVPHETALSVLTAMVRRFDQEATAINLPAAAKQVHLTEAQVITMASLVQAEGGRLSDYPKIARVIYNRLAQGMPLQLDSTVLYGLNTYGIIASDTQLNSTSPYNTYRYKGLTPGPIDSPGYAAIEAVLHPASGSWLYFVTVDPKTGETLFTSSPTQFEQFRTELYKNLGQ